MFVNLYYCCCAYISLVCRFVWPRDLCYVRYWRRNDDGSYGKGHCKHFLFDFLFLMSAPEMFFLIVQLCYFVLENMRTVVHNQVMCGLMLRVSFAFSSFMYGWNCRMSIRYLVSDVF